MSRIKFCNTSIICVVNCSLYNYDPSETYLLSVTTDGVSVEYRYNTNGDLIRSIIGVGYSSEIGYNENSFVESIREYANNELTSHYTYGFNWNGILNISVFPQNASTVLQHDRLGNVVSVTNDGGLPKISQEVPYGRRFLLGDEVSFIMFESEKFLHIFNFRSSQKIVWKAAPHTPLIKKEFKISL